MKSEGIHLKDEFAYYVWSNAIKYTVPLESIGAWARGETSSAAILFSSNLPRWDENRNLGKDESDRTPRLTWRGSASVTKQ